MKRDVRTHLEDADKAAEEIADFIAGTDLDGYLGNRMMQKAVERNLEIVGEAMVRLRDDSPETARRIPELKKVIGLRNVLIHKYDKVEPERIWHSILPALHEQRRTYQSLIAELGREGPRPDPRMADDVLVLSCAVSERVDPADPVHRDTLPLYIQEALRSSALATHVREEEVGEIASGIARKRAEADVRVAAARAADPDETRTTPSKRTSTRTRLPWPRACDALTASRQRPPRSSAASLGRSSRRVARRPGRAFRWP